LNTFDVDDLLCSVPTEEEATKLIDGICSLCQMGGFHVTKWLANNRAVLECVPEHDRGKGLASLDFEWRGLLVCHGMLQQITLYLELFHDHVLPQEGTFFQ
jgi:hypothetical protein